MLAFIDESGNPHPSDRCLTWSLACVCIPRDASRDLARILWGLKAKFYGRPPRPGIPPIELKAHQMFNRRTFLRAERGTDKAVAHMGFIEAVFSAISNFPDLSIFAITGARPSRAPEIPLGLLPWHYVFLLQRIHQYARSRGEGCSALVVFDQKDLRVDEGLASAFTHHLFNTWEGKDWSNIVETGMFVSSTNTPGVQLADLVASCLRYDAEYRVSGHYANGDPFAALVRKYVALVRGKSRDFATVGGRLFGIYHMPERYLFPRPRPLNVVIADPEEAVA